MASLYPVDLSRRTAAMRCALASRGIRLSPEDAVVAAVAFCAAPQALPALPAGHPLVHLAELGQKVRQAAESALEAAVGSRRWWAHEACRPLPSLSEEAAEAFNEALGEVGDGLERWRDPAAEGMLGGFGAAGEAALRLLPEIEGAEHFLSVLVADKGPLIALCPLVNLSVALRDLRRACGIAGPVHTCDGCGYTLDESLVEGLVGAGALNEPARLTLRLAAGAPTPSGECPCCGALAFPEEAAA